MDKKQSFQNILEKLFNFSSNVFNFDYYLLLVLCSYLFISFIYGTIKLGIRFLYIRIFSFKKSETNGLGLMFLTGYNCLLPLGIIIFLHELARESFSISLGYIKIDLFKNYIPYYDCISVFFIFQFIIVFVYSISISYSNAGGKKEYIDYETNDDSIDEERALLNII